MTFKIKQIGTIHTPYKTKDECPIQGSVITDSRGTIELLPEFEEGLLTIETFTHIMLFYIFDRAGEVILSRPTFLDDNPHGVFASRHPCRPNGIGISIVKLEKRYKNILEVSEIDLLDNTPLIDIKPYIPRFDHRQKAGNGWIKNLEIRDKPKNRE